MIPLGEESWREALGSILYSPELEDLWKRVEEAYQKKTVFPARDQVFSALELCPLRKVKVVLLGQDPYHGPGQATGLSFAVPQGQKLPPSLRNIFLELGGDLGVDQAKVQKPSSDLESWARQGVLLLNTSLTVEEGRAGSHSAWGWQRLTSKIVEILGASRSPLVFVLWGKHAQSLKKLICSDKHLILESAHPSPLSAYRGFFGSKPFSQANGFLESQGLAPIDWLVSKEGFKGEELGQI
jgi:uracil-DNA glycosylase